MNEAAKLLVAADVKYSYDSISGKFASPAVQAGYNILILSDRGLDPDHRTTDGVAGDAAAISTAGTFCSRS